MSRLSIYETGWIDLVFEDRNKEYGAYQLRRDSSKTLAMAFVSGIGLIAAIGLLFSVSNLMNKPIIVATPTIFDEPITVTPYTVLPEKPKTAAKSPQTKAPDETKANLPLVVSATPDPTVEVPTTKELLNNPQASAGGTETGTVTSSLPSGTVETPSIPVDEKAILNTTALDKLPEFPGGIKKFYSYVGNNFEKPDIEGDNTYRVYVSFVIERDGSMTDIKVIRDPGFGLGQEAIRVLKSLKTKWSPGMMGSKPVRTSYNLPITVEMN
jgi:periplasmic protein TonB